MQLRNNKKLLSCFLCMVLIVAAALCTNGCNGSAEKPSASGVEADADNGQAAEEDAAGEETGGAGSVADSAGVEANVLGEGDTKFAFTVTDQNGSDTVFEIHTDKETVGEALLEVGLIEGEESEYGLYVKTVNGITADYDKDGVYWAFYVNGEYAQTGVDSTAVTEGEAYAFKVEK